MEGYEPLASRIEGDLEREVVEPLLMVLSRGGVAVLSGSADSKKRSRLFAAGLSRLWCNVEAAGDEDLLEDDGGRK